MNDETLTMLAQAAAAFARPDASRVRKWRATPPGFDRAIWMQMAEQGWLSILVPEDLGGLGLGVGAAALIAERLGYALYPEPFVAAGALALQCVALGDNQSSKEGFLARLLSGKTVATVAWQGGAGSLSIEQTSITAMPAADGVSLTGNGRFAAVAAADAFIVSARTEQGIALYWVDRHHCGLKSAAEPGADGSMSARLELSDVDVTANSCVASAACASEVLQSALDTAIVATSAELVGLMERVMEVTLEYLRTRQQFGRPIGSFQALQHRAVDLWIQKELARAAVGAAARVLDDAAATQTARSAAASSAKARAAHAALLLCNHAVQLHGAIGFTDEHDLGLYLNRALVLSAWLGNAAEHRRRYGTLATGGLRLAGAAA